MTEKDLKLHWKGLARCVSCGGNLPLKAYHPGVQRQLPNRSPKSIRCRGCDSKRMIERYRGDKAFREKVKARNRAAHKDKMMGLNRVK